MKKYKILTPKGECLGECVNEGNYIKFEGGCYHPEFIKNLNLTLEEIKPVERKLYAYDDGCGYIVLRREEEKPRELSPYQRAPEYDIIYPVVTP